MKKLLVVLLTLALCVTSLASCDIIGKIFDTGTTGDEQNNEVVYNATAAADYVFNLYKNMSVTAADFEVTAVANIAGVKHTVEWSVDTDKVTIEKKSDTVYLVNVDEESPEEVKYVLTATVKGGDQVATKTFNLTVPKYELTSFEAYMAAKEGDNVVVKGIVVAINSKSVGNKYNHLFLADVEGKGGYYCYSMATDPIADDGIELGMTVEVSGPVTPYSGMQEIKGGTVRIVDSSIKTVEVLDITDKVANGESLANYVGLPVTIKGVEIAGQELEKETSQYLNFKLNGKTAYVRTYVTDFPTTLPVAEKANIDAAHAEHFGWLANATGILILYNSNPYLIPMGTDCFEYLNKIEKTPEQKIEDTLGQLTIGSLFNTDTVIDLPAAGSAYADVALTWATSDATNAAIADGKLTIVVPDTAVEVTITVTATCEGKTATKEFKATLTKMVDFDTFLDLPQANDIGILQGHNTYTAGKYFVKGTVESIANTTYGNLYIQDENGNKFYVYGLYSFDGSTRFDAMENQPAVGDSVVIYGVVGQYNGNAQMKNGWLMVAPAADSEIAIPNANALGIAQGHNTYTANKYYVTGEITEIANTKYGNLYIKDADGNTFYVYGLYTADGATRFDAMETKPAVGDTITVYGILGQYNGGAQMKNGWMTSGAASTPAVENETLNIKATEGTLAEDKLTISWATNTFNIVVYKNDSTSDIRVSDADHFRCYAKTKFTIAGTTENPIVKLVFTVTEAKYAEVLVNSATEAGYTATADGTTVTVVVGATSAEFVLTAQARFNKIDIVLDESSYTEPETPPAVDEPAADSTLSIKDAVALGTSKAQDSFTANKYYVTGVITEIKNTTYGNMYIKDAEGNSIYLYGLYSADGSVRFDAMETKPAVGDTITVYGVVGNYNGAQIKNAWMTSHTAGSGSTTPEAPNTPAAPTPDANGRLTYVFANFTAGEQYAANEVHVLDDKVTVTTNDAHFTKQIRLYQQAANQYGPARSGTAVFQTASAIKSLSINAGEKKVPIEVYGSTNGTDWVLITTITVEVTEYTDFEITLGSTEYTYIKLAAIEGQARVASVTFGF